MRGYWTETRPNGQPVESGTVCFVTDLEDGTNPIYTYGKDQAEVLEKLALQNANAQLAMARRNAPPAAPPPAPKPAISPDQIMQATEDLDDPAKSGQAIRTLVESETGLDLHQMVIDRFALLAMQWEQDNQDFYAHPANRHLIAQEAMKLAGGRSVGHISREHLDRAFLNLRAQGLIVEHPSLPDDNSPPQPSNPFPGENQVQRTERPRGTRFATGSRSTGFQRQTPTRTLKYTEADIRNMPMSQSKALIAANDKDYAEACEAYFGAKA